MYSALPICTFLSALLAFCTESVDVAVCNLAQIPQSMIEHAQEDATYVYGRLGVQVRWVACGMENSVENPESPTIFIVRVLPAGHLSKPGPVSLETMGMAYLDSSGIGKMADAYYGAIREAAGLVALMSTDQLLGYTIAHEVGHLLIGAGHRRNESCRRRGERRN